MNGRLEEAWERAEAVWPLFAIVVERDRYRKALLEIEAIHNSPASDAPVLIEQADKARQIANRAVTDR